MMAGVCCGVLACCGCFTQFIHQFLGQRNLECVDALLDLSDRCRTHDDARIALTLLCPRQRQFGRS